MNIFLCSYHNLHLHKCKTTETDTVFYYFLQTNIVVSLNLRSFKIYYNLNKITPIHNAKSKIKIIIIINKYKRKHT